LQPATTERSTCRLITAFGWVIPLAFSDLNPHELVRFSETAVYFRLLTAMQIESLKPQWLNNVDTDALCALLFILGLPIAFLIWLYVKWNSLSFVVQVYLAGVISYWFRWILKVIANCFRLLSVFDRNMAQIGMRRDVFLGGMQDKQDFTYFANFIRGVLGQHRF
jgi:hypothetical protein